MSAWVRVAALGSPETLARALLPWLFSERWLADEASRERSARGLAASVGRVRAEALERIAAGVLAWSGSRESALARLEVPTLVVVAGRDLLTPDGAAIADAIPGARRLALAESGHAVTVEAAEAVSAALIGHLGG
jgi:pimeloyl-ACP methyl ester carboxylesterase